MRFKKKKSSARKRTKSKPRKKRTSRQRLALGAATPSRRAKLVRVPLSRIGNSARAHYFIYEVRGTRKDAYRLRLAGVLVPRYRDGVEVSPDSLLTNEINLRKLNAGLIPAFANGTEPEKVSPVEPSTPVEVAAVLEAARRILGIESSEDGLVEQVELKGIESEG